MSSGTLEKERPIVADPLGGVGLLDRCTVGGGVDGTIGSGKDLLGRHENRDAQGGKDGVQGREREERGGQCERLYTCSTPGTEAWSDQVRLSNQSTPIRPW